MTPAITRILRLSGLAALAFAFAGTANASPGVTVVGYRSSAALRDAVAATGARVVRRIPALHVAVLATPPAAARVLAGLRGIRYSERPVLRSELVDPGLLPAPVLGGAYEWQYAGARENYVPAGVARAAAAITIAVIDTGIDVSAPDLAAKSPATWSVVSDSTDVTDYYGHGTFVASLAAGSPANGDGIAGFGGEAKLLAIQAAGRNGTFSDVDEAAAIVYAVNHGAKIINMSFGGPATTPTERSAIDYAAAHGVLMVAAAGNSGEGGDMPMYPAALLQPLGSNGQGGPGLAVGAASLGGNRAPFSNYGSYISLAAPGDDVFGALSSAADASDWPRQALPGAAAGIYGYGSGTSFASPEVAGAAALVWAANPSLSAADVAAILKQSASGNGNWNQDLGYGNLDVASAVARAQGVAASLPSVSLSGARAGLRLALSWRSPGAVSYRLSVRRDGHAMRELLGPTTATSRVFALEPGHSYSFTVSATDRYGQVATSSPYTVALPYASVRLEVHSARAAGAKPSVRVWTVFSPADKGVPRAGRKLVLESYDGRGWRRLSTASTDRAGIAGWTISLRPGTYRVRVRYAGAADAAPATSRALPLSVP